MTTQEKIEFAREEASRIIKDTFSGIIETSHIARLQGLFPAMFSGKATDNDALEFFSWLEIEYAGCF